MGIHPKDRCAKTYPNKQNAVSLRTGKGTGDGGADAKMFFFSQDPFPHHLPMYPCLFSSHFLGGLACAWYRWRLSRGPCWFWSARPPSEANVDPKKFAARSGFRLGDIFLASPKIMVQWKMGFSQPFKCRHFPLNPWIYGRNEMDWVDFVCRIAPSIAEKLARLFPPSEYPEVVVVWKNYWVVDPNFVWSFLGWCVFPMENVENGRCRTRKWVPPVCCRHVTVSEMVWFEEI